MLDVINRYCHGFVAVPVIQACQALGLFALLEREGRLPPEQLASRLGAHPGHLEAALRLLCSLGWLTRERHSGVTLGQEAAARHRLPPELGRLYQTRPSAPRFLEEVSGVVEACLPRCLERWGVGEGRTAELFDGALLLPLLHALRARGLLEEGERDLFTGLEEPLRGWLLTLLEARGWATRTSGSTRFTEAGRYLTERLLVTGVTVSYAPLLAQLPQLLAGDPRAPFGHDAQGHERHLDRTLNVLASGFQHERFFRDMEDALEALFHQLPLEEQPAYVADMGCGDGTLLHRLYERVRTRTARGQALERYPLRMIGIDYNPEALEVAAARLTAAGVPHLMLPGDIADPQRLERDLRQRGITRTERILHVRSFLDHDRPAREPPRRETWEARAGVEYGGVFVSEDGGQVPPAAAFHSLVEHLRGWARLPTRHGLLLLEVHCLDEDTAGRFLDQSESAHFDALQAFSHQQLLEAGDFVLAAAEAGLFTRPGFFQRYPRTLPFTRVTLGWYEPRPYRIRNARLEDLPALRALETEAWAPGLGASEAELRRRLERFPRGQCVVELEGRVVGALYTQRIASVEALTVTPHAGLAGLASDGGAVLQLLGVAVAPAVQDLGLGDQLLEFMLQYGSLWSGVEQVVGVTRCAHYTRTSGVSLEDYIRRQGPRGLPEDPVLAFHASHGASIVRVLPHFRPEDTDNLGAGVLITYDPRQRHSQSEAPPTGAREASAPVAHVVERCARAVLGPRRAEHFSLEVPFKDLGMDSLDLLELRTALSGALGEPLEPTFFFRHTSPGAVARFFERAPGAHKASAAPKALPRHQAPRPREAPRPPGGTHEHEPMALVGMGCRFAGGIHTPEAYWELLREGRDALSEVPRERGGGELGPLLSVPELPAVRRGGFLKDVEQFDAAFFGIAPREARAMDPQQRLLLEVAWEALERAGLDPRRLEGSRTGVFLGLFGHDYELLQWRSTPSEQLDLHASTGTAPSVAAGRLSYTLGLQGPAVTVDTACSSSLVALHLACQSLRAGECEQALVGGVNLILSPEPSLAFARGGMLSPEGRCKSFDRSADGYVRGEGCAVVVVKPLSRALAAGEPILAVVRGSALNQDGRSNGLTAPNGQAQEEVLRQALAQARVDAHEVHYVEAHGTGTSLGDPIEVGALEAVYGARRDAQRPLWLGSVKANLGHTEAAAGLAGVLKVVLALQHGQLPPQPHFHQPNPQLHLERIPARVPTRVEPWPREPGGARRRAAVSSFGYSGTNAHVVLEEAPVPEAPETPEEPRPKLVMLSARDARALEDMARAWAEAAPRDGSLGALSQTANVRRARFEHRLAVVASTGAQLRERLEGFLRGEPHRRVVSARAEARPRVAFLFTGQGSQAVDMGRGLYEAWPVFREALERCDALLRQCSETRLVELLYTSSEGARLDETLHAQPALFSLEYALYRLWESWGVRPDAVLGHSVGEYVAACVAGVLSLEDGLRLISARARGMQALASGGAMASVRAPGPEVEAVLAVTASEVELAGLNGPSETVISGRAEAVAAACAAFERRGVRCVRLRVSHAFHSRLVEPMLPSFGEACARVAFSPPTLPYVSNLTGELLAPGQVDARYWMEHARRPVRFAQGVQALLRRGYTHFLELGPRPVLSALGRASDAEDSHLWLSSLAPGVEDEEQLLSALGALHASGVAVDWEGVHLDGVPEVARLPTYPFQRQRYWLAAPNPARRAPGPERGVETSHPLLGRRLELPTGLQVFETGTHELTRGATAFLREHRVHGTPLLPASAYVELALAAMARLAPGRPVTLEALRLESALELTEEPARRVQLVLIPSGRGRHQLRVLSATGPGDTPQEWTLHAQGSLSDEALPDPVPGELATLRARMGEALSLPDFLSAQGARGVELGVGARALRGLWRAGLECLSQISLPEEFAARADTYVCHPLLLDACFFSALAVLGGGREKRAHVLVGLERLRLSRPGVRSVWCHAHAKPRSEGGGPIPVDLRLYDEQGTILAHIEGCAFQPLAGDATRTGDEPWRDWLYQVRWRRTPLEGGTDASALPAPGALHASLVQGATELLAPQTEGDLSGLAQALERLSLHYAGEALGHLGWAPQPGEREEVEVLAERLGVVAGHRRLLRRVLEGLHEEGLLRLEGDVVTVSRPLGPWAAAAELRALRERHPGAAVELTLLERCGASLAQVLRGDVEPLSLIFPESDLSTAARLYEHAPSFSPMNALAARAMGELIARLPPERPLRVLEIGAGTGGTSAWLIPALSAARCEYVLTDVSSRFLTAARERFSSQPFVRYQRLDVEQAPAEQGVRPRAYDVVIAANVLHATRELEHTLHHARELLAPGGLLLLIEGTARRRWIDLIFGLLPGWWRTTDTSLRAGYPLLSASRWVELLERCGFTGARAVEPPNATNMLFPQALLLATARHEAEAPRVPVQTRRWLLFADGLGVAERLAERLRSRGQECVLARAAREYGRESSGEYRLDPGSPEHLERLVRERSEAGLDAVVYLWGLDRAPQEGAEACMGALRLIQALTRLPPASAPETWWVTQGAQPLPDTRAPLSPAQAALWGLGLVLEQEHPELRGRLVDLDPSRGPEAAEELLEELEAADRTGPVRVGYRERQRYEPRLTRLEQGKPLAPLRAEASYLISGGLGGMGLHVARWLVEHGARQLVLLGRGEPSPEARQVLAGLEPHARVEVLRTDVSQREELARTLEHVRRTLPPLRGVVHCAGVFGDALLAQQEAALVERVFDPKVLGAWNLHALTEDLGLDHFLLFSSVFSLLGSAGLGNYAAANASLDALAALRRQRGLPALSIAWGPWDRVGMARAVGERREAQWTALGLRRLPASAALRALEPLLDTELSQAAIVDATWSELASRSGTSGRRFLQELLTASPGNASPVPGLRERLEGAPPGHQRTLLLEYVSGLVARVLGFAEGQAVDTRRGLFDLGMDSLTAMDLRGRLQRELGHGLPATLLMQHPTIQALTDYLTPQVLSSAEPSAPAPGARPGSIAPGAPSVLDAPAPPPGDTLAGEELEASIAAELEELERLLQRD